MMLTIKATRFRALSAPIYKLPIVCLIVFLVASVAMSDEDQIKTFDDDLLQVTELLPDFGGFYFDEKGDLNVYLIEAEPDNPDYLKEKLPQIEQAFSAVFGEAFLTRLPGLSPEHDEPEKEPKVNLLKADYSISELADWLPALSPILSKPGVIMTHLDEAQNRLSVGIEALELKPFIEDVLEEAGVPSDAVLIQETSPIIFMQGTTTLTDRVRPLIGGLQIQLAASRCTLGFNAYLNNMLGGRGFVTNSHCTDIQGGVEPTWFYQNILGNPPPSDPNYIGSEYLDPSYFTSTLPFGRCPLGRRCRYSDSAFARYSINAKSEDSRLARTMSYNGSLTIDPTTDGFRIVSEAREPMSGEVLNKVGSTTGWTFGTVTDTCVNIRVMDRDANGLVDSGITLLCQNMVERVLPVNAIVQPGDSGSPVFSLTSATSDVRLYGLLWGGDEAGTTFAFSAMRYIEDELGELQTVGRPGAPPPTRPPQGPHPEPPNCPPLSEPDCHAE